jgi:hypothetical protein
MFLDLFCVVHSIQKGFQPVTESLYCLSWDIAVTIRPSGSFVIGVNQLQKHVIILKTQILNGRLIRISNLRRDVRCTFQRASPLSDFHHETIWYSFPGLPILRI